MIILYHRNSKVKRVYNTEHQAEMSFTQSGLTNLIIKIASDNPEQLLVWCEESVSDSLNLSAFSRILIHEKMLVSYNPLCNYLPTGIGYVELGLFIKVNKQVRFPTWQMSSLVGAMPSPILNVLESHVTKDDDFGYFLNSLAKIAMPLGLFCYSEPNLLKGQPKVQIATTTVQMLFRFVAQHYKSGWVFLLLFNMMVYERKFPVFPALTSIFYKKRTLPKSIFESVAIIPAEESPKDVSIDVLIPTIGRKPYLHDLLKDLAEQTLLPSKVIITEQNPLPGSSSELDFLVNESWPFEIKHIFTHQPGACNARNLALAEVNSDWIFLADDDIRIEGTFLEDALSKIAKMTGEVFNICCINPGETRQYELVHQTSIFAGGCSIISKKSCETIFFDTAYEFGYGEDSDFGMQLMNKGHDIKYLPEPAVKHLKAPSGGVRTKIRQLWDDDVIKPKPSPTVLLFKLVHHTTEQLRGYKTILLMKYYRHQSIKNPFKYYKVFKAQWNRSVFWANELKSRKQIKSPKLSSHEI